MQMIIANTLVDGFVVFLTADHGWTNDIESGAVAADDAATLRTDLATWHERVEARYAK